MLKMRNIIIVLIAIFSFCACNRYSEPMHLTGFTQGTYYQITYFDSQNRDLQSSIDSILADFDTTASIYISSSIISRLNRNETDVVLNEDFVDLFTYAMQVSEQTEGKFDITLAPIIDAWGFGAGKERPIDSVEIDSLLSNCVGWKKLKIEHGQLLKANPCVQMNMNAIAQGYAVDKIAKFLEDLSINNFIVDIGGEVYASGSKGNKKWKVGIEQPAKDKTSQQQIAVALPLQDMAIVTSGNYRKYKENNGKQYGHTIDSQTGRPAENSILSATVMHQQATMADAYATAIMAMGYEKTMQFLQNHQELDVYLIYLENDQEKTFLTNGFKKLINEE